jgi:hypothetical protein
MWMFVKEKLKKTKHSCDFVLLTLQHVIIPVPDNHHGIINVSDNF